LHERAVKRGERYADGAINLNVLSSVRFSKFGGGFMMNDMMGGGMMWGMGLIWLLVAIVLILGIAALVKYLFFAK
jgi:hypothetical protein